ncbi:MAG: hypothetical protein P1U38_04285 [Aeromicrobium sp.]|uniref:YunG family protein n=1 Tax=Aeromicrobium sp. TaxID=1871063 RepID=UPI002627902F|nr:hypothetical protein [Aeromicrobium sp.]MDF1703969.1 hypothetical protein [Aeromicrobium sp.]
MPASAGAVALEELTAALRLAWGPDTCAPEDQPNWSTDNPARGQCITTVLVVHDAFGGQLVRGEVDVDGSRVDYHWWNRSPDGTEIDLTREQFHSHESIVGRVLVERPWGQSRIDEEYARLSARVRQASEPPATS